MMLKLTRVSILAFRLKRICYPRLKMKKLKLLL